jgi:hypothetical protein
MSENINLYDSFEPEARQGRRQADDYMETRPYEDKAGGKHHPVTGELIDIDDESLTTGDVHTDKNYFEANRNQHYEDSMPTAYEDMTMPDLARALAAAEHQADKTKAEDIQDALIDKMSEFSDKNGLDSDAQDNLWNRIMRVKDGEGEKLGGETSKSKEEDTDAMGDEVMPTPYSSDSSEKSKDEQPESDDKEMVTATEFEYTSTIDPEEAKAFWEAELKDQGIALDDYLAHEKEWIVKRAVEKVTDPSEPTEPTVPPVEPKPTEPPVEPKPVEPKPTQPPVEPKPIAPRPIKPEEGESRVNPKPEKRGRLRKWGRGIMAGLALLGGGYAAGRGHEMYIDKVYDTPSVLEINRAEDNTRDLSEATQEEMVRNFERTEAFFDSIKTAEGAENFKQFEKIYDEAVEKFTAKFGNTLPKERIEELAEKEVQAKLAALAYHEAEAAAQK